MALGWLGQRVAALISFRYTLLPTVLYAARDPCPLVILSCEVNKPGPPYSLSTGFSSPSSQNIIQVCTQDILWHHCHRRCGKHSTDRATLVSMHPHASPTVGLYNITQHCLRQPHQLVDRCLVWPLLTPSLVLYAVLILFRILVTAIPSQVRQS